MAQQMIKENKMLKELVSALEKQNDSRNLERDTLVRQIDRLSEENDILRDQLKKTNKNTENSNQLSNLMRSKKQVQKNLFEVQNHLQHALNQQSIIESQNEKLRIQVQTLNNKLKGSPTKNQFESNEKEIQRLKLENEELKKKASLIQNIQRQASSLEKQNSRLKQNISQLKSNEIYKEQQLQQRISQFRNAQTQQIRQILKKQSEKEKNQEIAQLRANYELAMKNKDQLLRELESKLNSANTKAYQNENSSTLQMRQLRLSKVDLENKLNALQSQKKWMQKKIKELELESSYKHNLINQKQIQSTQLDEMRMNVEKKQQQLSRCQTVIDALNQNIALLQNMVRQLQIQLQNFKHAAKDFNRQEFIQTESKYQNEIIKLKQQLYNQERIYPEMLEQEKKYSVEKERENLQLKKILSELSENNKNLLAKIKFSQSQQQVQSTPHIGQKHLLDNNDPQLRNIVQELRKELKQVKSDFKRIENDNRKMQSLVHSKTVESQPTNEPRNFGYINSKFTNNEQNYKSRQKSRISTKNIQEFSQKYTFNYPLIHAEQEEPKVKVTKLDRLGQKSRVVSGDGNSKAMHRDKWQMLQKRINQLRQENEELKHSLYS